jgi:putative transposase
MAVRREGLKVKLAPNNVQATSLARSTGARRFAYNWALAVLKAHSDHWKVQRLVGVPAEQRINMPSAKTLQAMWRHARPDWAGELSSWVFSWACIDARQAMDNFLCGRAKFPHFKRKNRDIERFTIVGRDIPLEVGRLKVPKLGWVAVAGACPAQAKLRRLIRRNKARVTSVTISREADRSWWASFKIERTVVHKPEHPNPDGPVVGVDVGIKVNATAVTAEGEVVARQDGLNHRRRAQRQLTHAQREQSRRYQRGVPTDQQSRGWHESKAKVGRLHAKVRRQRADDLHCFSKAATDLTPVVVLEDLAVANLIKNRHLAPAISDQGWGELGRQIRYKAEKKGGLVLTADRFFPSSKMCSRCKTVKPKLALSTRVFICESCGLIVDRDDGAATNLAVWGEEQIELLRQLVLATQSGNLDPPGPSGDESLHACGGGRTDGVASKECLDVQSVPADKLVTSQPEKQEPSFACV